jgi:hypothetical protein
MSYEPTIIIRKSDLEKHRDHIENAEWDAIPKKKFIGRKAKEEREELELAYGKLKEALNMATVSFTELEFVILYVEFTSRNGAVRSLLDELKIEYKLDN